MRTPKKLKEQLLNWAEFYNRPVFIEDDPISIPHRFHKLQDIEISGFIAATLAWGQRKTIINSTNKIIDKMDNAPLDFILNHEDKDLKRFEDCKHRTFNYTDLLYFIHFLKHHYQSNKSLETAFFRSKDFNVEQGLNHFNQYFFSLPDAPQRTQKHVAAPRKKSACKRLNMFLRWMVRKDNKGVDFGLWEILSPSKLMIPLDIHVLNAIKELWRYDTIKPNWQGVEMVTKEMREILPEDPAKLDFALFGYSIEKRKQNMYI